MTEPVLIDTGPLYAILDSRDEHHAACVATLRKLRQPPRTCWAVLTEAAWLLRNHPRQLDSLLRMCAAGELRVLTIEPETASWLADLMKRYEDLPAQLADASLVYLAERENIDTVFTTDRRDFLVYRTTDGRALEIIP